MEPYREHQLPPTWIMFLLGLIAVFGFTPQAPEPQWIFPLLAFVVFAVFMRMNTVVDSENITVSYGVTPFFTRRFAIADIEKAETKTYRPIWDYGGWGPGRKGRDGGRAYASKGGLAVMLTMDDGKRILIGTMNPPALENAIHRAMIGAGRHNKANNAKQIEDAGRDS